MSHNIVIINDRLDSLIGNATTGFLVTFKQTVNAADTWAQGASMQDAEEMHEQLHDAQELLNGDYELEGGIEATAGFIVSEMNELMGV